MNSYLKLAWRNMWRNWRRTTIALIAIVLGLILLLFFDGMITGSDQAIFGNAVRLYGGNIQIHAPGYRAKAARLPMYPLPNADAVVQTARATPHVVSAGRRINTVGLVASKEGSFPVTITGLEPAIEARVSIQAENLSRGRYLQDDDADAIYIGQGLADLLKVDVGDRVTLIGRDRRGEMRQRSVTIVGIYNLGVPEAEERAVFITLAEAQKLYNLRRQVTEVTVLLDDIRYEETVLAALQSALPGLEVDSWQTLRPEIRETMDTKQVFTGVIGVIVILIASIGILNLMMMAVFERTREMGILAALGLKNRQIMGLFLLEGTLIGVVGAAAGCILGAVLLAILGQVGIEFTTASQMGEIGALMGDRLYPAVTPAGIIIRGVLVAIIAALASIYPAWQAARREPAEALHHV
ncbi:MAG: ABC transporter permease [Chloroflexi bacterium]|nr:MAG: ABC transporter permease [Chloroflexota bacterium]